MISTGLSFRFGPFCLVPKEGLLLKGDTPVRLGSRAFDMLIALVEHEGELVSNDELMARVWPNTFVEAGNLRVHMFALRKALADGRAGDRYVGNIPGRGYRFLAPVLRINARSTGMVTTGVDNNSTSVPAFITHLIGRDDTVVEISNKVVDKRLVTIVGTGGVGKTTVALAVAHALAGSFGQSIRFLNFSALSNPDLLSSTVASSFGLQVGSNDPLPYLVGYLRERRMLIVLDSCEHLIDAAATLVEGMFREAADVYLLVTSREPLRVEGEHVLRLAPLETPPAKADISAQEGSRFSGRPAFRRQSDGDRRRIHTYRHKRPSGGRYLPPSGRDPARD
jgi:DNA-binding winged helix-turn-helix (wHTH) protein